MKNWEKNIESILGEDAEVAHENALRFLTHLKNTLTLPLTVTGREDFPWEEPYVLGGKSAVEYAKLKKSNPSYTDLFELSDILPSDDDDHDLLAEIVRKSDKKTFFIGLSWLTTENKKSPGYRELDDYANWHANY